jgi:hypothetical protein
LSGFLLSFGRPASSVRAKMKNAFNPREESVLNHSCEWSGRRLNHRQNTRELHRALTVVGHEQDAIDAKNKGGQSDDAERFFHGEILFEVGLSNLV